MWNGKSLAIVPRYGVTAFDMNWITFMVGQMIIHVVSLTACVLFTAVYWGVVLMLGDLIGA